jgi:predicted lipoprotein with Yx(FWY)xxD motif
MVSNSALGMMLADNRGMTLYINKNDTPFQSSCTGTCAQNWPPLIVPNRGQATLDPSATGQLSTLSLPDGTTQVTYNGMPLYYYSGDQQPGDTNGQAINGIWSVVTSSGSNGAGTVTPPMPSGSPTTSP